MRAAEGIEPTPWLAAHVAKQQEGNRDSALFWAACRAAEADITDYQPLINAATTTAVLPEHQATRTVRSVVRTIRPAKPGSPTGLTPTQAPCDARVYS